MIEKILQLVEEYKLGVSFVIIIAIVIFIFTQNAYLATHLEECRIQNEQYKQNPPRIEPGAGGFDNWESNLIPND